jgi:hypothetical protein
MFIMTGLSLTITVIFTTKLPKCAGSSGAVHSVFLINVYLDLENPGGSGFWVGENRRVTEGT